MLSKVNKCLHHKEHLKNIFNNDLTVNKTCEEIIKLIILILTFLWKHLIKFILCNSATTVGIKKNYSDVLTSSETTYYIRNSFTILIFPVLLT